MAAQSLLGFPKTWIQSATIRVNPKRLGTFWGTSLTSLVPSATWKLKVFNRGREDWTRGSWGLCWRRCGGGMYSYRAVQGGMVLQHSTHWNSTVSYQVCTEFALGSRLSCRTVTSLHRGHNPVLSRYWVLTKYVLVCTQCVRSMYSVRTLFELVCSWYVLVLRPALQDLEECCVMQTCWCQMHSNHLQIRILTGVITEIPAQRMKNILTDRMQPLWKRQSACLWMAWRHRNPMASLNCTVCLGACLCQQPRQVKQWHTKTRWKAVLSCVWPRRSRSDLHHLNFSCTSMPWNTGTNWFDCNAYKECTTLTCKYIPSTY